MANIRLGMFMIGAGLGDTLMELAGGQSNYRQLAEEIGEVLQAAAETAEKMQEDARVEAARIRAEAEAELKVAYAEGRRVLDDARMESDMVRAEAEWQAQEIIAQARRHAAERMAGADSRLADLQRVESRVLDRLAGVGQVLADSLATLREGPAIGDIATPATLAGADTGADGADGADDDAEHPTGKVYFVEFPPYATPAAPAPPVGGEPEAEREIILSASPGASLFADEVERSEWAPPVDMPVWWTRDGIQG